MFGRALVFGLILLGCTPSGEEIFSSKTQNCESNDLKLTDEEGDELALADKVVSWESDILPMLRSAEGKRKYKCVNCHPLYENIDQLNTSEKLRRILRTVDKATYPNAAMPVGGEFQAADVALLKAWEKGGFLEATPKSATSSAGGSSPAAQSNCK